MDESVAGEVPVPLRWSAGIGLDAVVETADPVDDVYTRSGVYIWILRHQQTDGPFTETLSYVGRATGRPTLWERLRQHYCCQIGGSYMMPREFIPPELRPAAGHWAVDWQDASVRETLANKERFTKIVHAGFHDGAYSEFRGLIERR